MPLVFVMVKWVLSILHKHNMYPKPEKCEFETKKVEYLGLVVCEGMVEMHGNPSERIICVWWTGTITDNVLLNSIQLDFPIVSSC